MGSREAEGKVNRLTMLVTSNGEWVLPDSEEFLRALGDENPDYDSVGFAIKNLGFIKYELVGQSIVEIDLNPRNVEFPALLAVQQQILTAGVNLFRIRYFDNSWHSEISSSSEHTIGRLSELCTPVFAPPPTEKFIVEPIDYSKLLEDEGNQFRPLAQKWRISFGHFDPNVIALAMNNQLLSRMMIVGVKPRQEDPIFRFIGDGHRWFGNSYHVNAIGEKVEHQPDHEYGSWVSEFYKAVARSGQPRYDLVTAALRYEEEDGKPRRTVRYERLLLPWKTPSDETLVTLCSKVVGCSNMGGSESAVARSLADPENSEVIKLARSS